MSTQSSDSIHEANLFGNQVEVLEEGGEVGAETVVRHEGETATIEELSEKIADGTERSARHHRRQIVGRIANQTPLNQGSTEFTGEDALDGEAKLAARILEADYHHQNEINAGYQQKESGAYGVLADAGSENFDRLLQGAKDGLYSNAEDEEKIWEDAITYLRRHESDRIDETELIEWAEEEYGVSDSSEVEIYDMGGLSPESGNESLFS